MHPSTPSVAWSEFARGRHVPGGKHTWFEGTEDDLLALVRASWPERTPGAGRSGLDEVVVVPVPAAGFHGTTVEVATGTVLHARLDRRQPGEEPFIRVTAEGEPAPPRWAGVVLYHASVLTENGGARSSDADWEVVCLLAGDRPDEPMDPVTMARNFLEKPGGTFAPYSAHDFAEAIWFWSRRAARHHPEETP